MIIRELFSRTRAVSSITTLKNSSPGGSAPCSPGEKMKEEKRQRTVLLGALPPVPPEKKWRGHKKRPWLVTVALAAPQRPPRLLLKGKKDKRGKKERQRRIRIPYRWAAKLGILWWFISDSLCYTIRVEKKNALHQYFTKRETWLYLS